MPRPRESRWPKKFQRGRRLPEWSSTGMFNIGIAMTKSTLAVMIMPMAGFWECAAITAPTSAGSLAAVFDEHGHKVLGRFTDIQKAVTVCEAYARKWIKGQEKIERCACKEIMKHAKPVRIDAEFEPRGPRRNSILRSRRKAA